jgi:hypothetical protein
MDSVNSIPDAARPVDGLLGHHHRAALHYIWADITPDTEVPLYRPPCRWARPSTRGTHRR